jgi:hypothetical protein
VFSLELDDADLEGIELARPNAMISFDSLHRSSRPAR